jgi:hypothetical protein
MFSTLCQVDFVMAYPQAPVEMDMYMELPTGIHTKHGNSKDHEPTSTGKIKLVAYGTAISSPSYGRSTSSSHLLTIASFIGIRSFSL